MIVLFSPSESKRSIKDNEAKRLDFEHFSFLGDNSSYRQRIINAYIKALCCQDEAYILKLFGTRTLDLNILAQSQNLLNAPCIEAIRLYSGVAYKALDFENQSQRAKTALLEHVVIFSNLFGVLRAKDFIPFYRLKQGSFVGDFKAYYANFTQSLHEFCQDEDILDLRAEFYQTLYTPKSRIFRPYFYKNNKRQSHYAKAYRGDLLRQIAHDLGEYQGETLMQADFEGLRQRNCHEQKGVVILEYDICD